MTTNRLRLRLVVAAMFSATSCVPAATAGRVATVAGSVLALGGVRAVSPWCHRQLEADGTREWTCREASRNERNAGLIAIDIGASLAIIGAMVWQVAASRPGHASTS
jgi:hypothetical protein